KLKSMPKKEEVFYFSDYNIFYNIDQEVMGMGFTKGHFHTVEDFLREKDRATAKAFLKQHYTVLEVAETKQFGTGQVDQAIAFMQISDKVWVVKSDGNFGETIVPDSKNSDMARNQAISELTTHKAAYAKGPLSLEEKIMDAIEFCPQLAFWDGKPIYATVEIETRMLGPADSGGQTGGNQNLIARLPLDGMMVKMFFPPVVYELAAQRRGLFLFDIGILYDPSRDKYLGIEYAGNRHGWPGINSEISMAEGQNRATNYFEAIAQGRNPLHHAIGVTLSTYALEADPVFPALLKEGLAIDIRERMNILPYQVRYEQGRMVNVGYRAYDSGALAHVVARGDDISGTVRDLFYHLENLSFKGLYYRSQEDFLSMRYPSSIPSRAAFLVQKELADICFDMEAMTPDAPALLSASHPGHEEAVAMQYRMATMKHPG
ncbi:MAG: hypothetical protein NTY64_04095, partial [Deltaproteobacteria bacterium]|nr:hypothetical protein [Deltaproteobacteria bacterium]